MFTFDSIVDTVSGAQKQFLETFVVDKKVQGELVKLVEAQAKFAKSSYKTTLETAENTVKHFNESIKSFGAKKAGA